MSSDLSVTRVGAVSASAEVARPAGAVPGDKRGPGPEPAAAAPVGKSLPNPTLRLDPGLAIVVIEFRDETGAVRSTIPTEQQLEAYRSWDRGHIGEAPRGAREPAGGGAAIGGAATGGVATRDAGAPGTAVTITGYTSTAPVGTGGNAGGNAGGGTESGAAGGGSAKPAAVEAAAAPSVGGRGA